MDDDDNDEGGFAEDESDSIPNGDEEVYKGGNITKGQLFTLVLAFILRHCCSKSALVDLLSLLNLLVPGCLPRSAYLFRRFLNKCTDESIDMHVICSSCASYIGKFESGRFSKCNECGTDNNCGDISSGNSFYTWSIKSQLLNLFKQADILKAMRNARKSDKTDISDVCDGSQYAKLNINFPNSISLACNTDGVPLFNSSNKVLWPVYFIVNELPFALRNTCMLLSALWLGSGKPRVECLFKPIVDELVNLCTSGFSWLYDGNLVTTTVRLAFVTCDSVARPILQNMKQFNGEFGCPFCLMKGDVVAKGRGHVRSYSGNEAERRTHLQVLRNAQEALQQNRCVFGVKGPSILSVIPKFDIVRNFVPDYMHAVLLGTVRQLVFLWLDTKSHSKPYYLGHKSKEIDSLLLSLRPPSEIKRSPRSLDLRKYWKASEWRNFLLFYSFPCLKGVLPLKYMLHWHLLIFSIFNLMKTPIKPDVLRKCNLALHKFAGLMADLYGEENCSFNIHLLTHLASSVRWWGPLWATSAFVFEDANGRLLNFFHGTKGVSCQIFKSFTYSTCLRKLAKRYMNTPLCEVVFDQLLNITLSCKFVQKISCDTTLIGNFVRRLLSVNELLCVQDALHTMNMQIVDNKIDEYDRGVVRGQLLHTEQYCEKLKVQDCCITLRGKKDAFVIKQFVVVNATCNGQGAIITRLLFLLLEPLACTNLYTIDVDIDANVTNHILKVNNQRHALAAHSDEFVSKVFSVCLPCKRYVLYMPKFELD